MKNAKSKSLTKLRKNNAGELEKTGFEIEKYFELFFGEKNVLYKKSIIEFFQTKIFL